MTEFNHLDTRFIDYYFEAPLCHGNAKSSKLKLYARIITNAALEKSGAPYLLYLNGGPGFECMRPTTRSGFIDAALDHYRIVLLDQRGTGNSSAFDLNLLSHFSDAEAIADYLSNFRADSIVRDAEILREKLGVSSWDAFGQSFGGFCILTYLSLFPKALTRAMITGGLPPIGKSAFAVYQATHARMLSKNQDYFRRFPEDEKLCIEITQNLRENKPTLPSGIPLTTSRFQQLGLLLGKTHGAVELHHILSAAFVDEKRQQLSFRFLQAVENQTSAFETNSLYALLHESIYCEGEASRWAAERSRKNFPALNSDSSPFRFTAEMIYPSFFHDYRGLKRLEEAANILAEKDDWSSLYDEEQLADSDCRVSALVYEDDLFVEKEFSLEAAKMLAHCNVWITNEYEHDGLRQDPKRIFERLLKLS